jgi:hypothetical protein
LLLAATRRWAVTGTGRATWTVAAVLLVVGGAAATGYRDWDQKRKEAAEVIVNPLLPPLSMEGEGEGPQGPFFPSSTRTAAGELIDSSFFRPRCSRG